MKSLPREDIGDVALMFSPWTGENFAKDWHSPLDCMSGAAFRRSYTTINPLLIVFGFPLMNEETAYVFPSSLVKVY